MIKIYTDGSCIGNPGNGGWAAIIIKDGKKTQIKGNKKNKNMFEVTVEFVSEIISCMKDKDNKIISGDTEKIKKVHDIWKFSKDIRSTNPNWFVIDTQA